MDDASHSSSSQGGYDVFLSFRGEDTRNNFTGHLYDALCRRGIEAFIDAEKLRRGQLISPSLLAAIESSKFSIIVLSENYASSRWCLVELVKILDCMKTRGQQVLPIFYNVDPSDMRNQRGNFGDALNKHGRSHDTEEVQVWRNAITEVANLSGWDSRNKHEPSLIKEIVGDVFDRLHAISSSDAGDLVGIDPHFRKMESLLSVGSNDVRISTDDHGRTFIQTSRCFGSVLIVLDEAGLPQEQGRNQRGQPVQRATPVLEKRLRQFEEFPLEKLRQATDNFSDQHMIGEGGFGTVYRAVLEGGKEVAIKRAKVSITSGMQEYNDVAFVNELELQSRVNHRNLVGLLGYCEDYNELILGYERILVYDYMNNGTLSDHLHYLKNSPLQSWTNRLRVALDAARGIEYLHTYAVPQFIHRDVKSSNIVLDTSLTAKVADFGLSLMGPKDEDPDGSSLPVAGTVGYIDPVYFNLQQLTTKTDVYSFGVVLLELLSGYKVIHKSEHGVPRHVVDFVVPYIVRDEIHRVLDPNVPPPTSSEIEAITCIGYIAADCVTLEVEDRPSMTEIVHSLERALTACFTLPSSHTVLKIR